MCLLTKSQPSIRIAISHFQMYNKLIFYLKICNVIYLLSGVIYQWISKVLTSNNVNVINLIYLYYLVSCTRNVEKIFSMGVEHIFNTPPQFVDRLPPPRTAHRLNVTF